MNKILLISEDYIKTHSNLNENVWGEYLTPAIREAQDIGLQQIIGSCLYYSILSKVEDGSILEESETAYKTLLDDYIQPYLMYQVITDLVPIIGVKLANIGVVISNDEHVNNLGEAERNRLGTYYKYRADFYCGRLQSFLLGNKALFKELDECTCQNIKATLDSAASIGLFLGGVRGRRIRGKNCC